MTRLCRSVCCLLCRNSPDVMKTNTGELLSCTFFVRCCVWSSAVFLLDSQKETTVVLKTAHKSELFGMLNKLTSMLSRLSLLLILLGVLPHGASAGLRASHPVQDDAPLQQQVMKQTPRLLRKVDVKNATVAESETADHISAATTAASVHRFLPEDYSYMPDNEFVQSGSGTVYYVDSATGSDGNNGLSEGAAFATLPYGINRLGAGDTLYVKNGNEYRPTIDMYKNLQIQSKGSPGDYILIAAFPGHRPVIHVASMNGVQLWNAEYVEFRGFEVRGIDDPPFVNTYDTTQNGGGISAFGNIGCKYIRIVDNHVHHVGGNGIGIGGADQILVLGNRVWHCTHRSTNGNSGIAVIAPKDLAVTTQPYGTVIADNVIFDNVNQFPFSHAGQITDGNGIIFDFYSNSNRYSYSKRMLAANNVAYANGGRCIHAYVFFDVDVVHNSCYGNLRSENLRAVHGELGFANADGIKVYNNIAKVDYATNAMSFLATTIQCVDCEAKNNILIGGVFDNGVSVTQTITTDPMYAVESRDWNTVDLHLKPGSPAIDAAITSETFGVDLDGTERPQGNGPDIGAYEVLSGQPAPVTPSPVTAAPVTAAPVSTASPVTAAPIPAPVASPPTPALTLPEGYINVVEAGADPTCATDTTSALQSAILRAKAEEKALFFPPGTYCISERLDCQQVPNEREKYPIVFVGSTASPTARATIVLLANSPQFQDPNVRVPMVHFWNTGTIDVEGGNPDMFNDGVISVDFKVESGNDGAVAVRLQGAEGTTLQDINIDLTEGGHTGIWGVPGSGGSTHNIKVVGGEYGIDTRWRKFQNGSYSLGGGGSQPSPVVSGATLIDQRSAGVYCATRGACTLVGLKIQRSTPGNLIHSLFHWWGEPYDGSIQLIDAQLEYTGSAVGSSTMIGAPFHGRGRSFVLENSYVYGATELYDSVLPADPTGWVHFKRAAAFVDIGITRGWGRPNEDVYVDGTIFGSTYDDKTTGVAGPPSDLQSRHLIPDDFPSWETPGVVNVQDLGAVGDGVTDDWQVLQQAIDTYDMLFFPKGVYAVSDTLTLRSTSKLIGVYHQFSTITALSTTSRRFGGIADGAPDIPIIETPDDANAEVTLGFLHVKRLFPLSQHNPTPPGNFALSWRCGGKSMTRHVQFQSNPDTNIRPDFIARFFYKLSDITVDPNHPQSSLPAGTWAWPNDHPNILVHGNGGGRFFNMWCHGRQGLRENVPFIRVQGVTNRLQFYHMHLQQQDSINLMEVLDSQHVTIYGTKGELKGTQVYFENSSNVRLFGHGGLSSPDVTYKVQHLFRFVDCSNFLIAGINDDINEGTTRWIGGPFDRWVHTNIRDFSALLDDGNGGTVSIPHTARPILYLRGDPSVEDPDNDNDVTPATPAPAVSDPVTSAPVTSAPITMAPVTASPVTAAPVTASPITASPVTATPVTASPVTASPITASPVTATPVTASPVAPPSGGIVMVGEVNRGIAFTDSNAGSKTWYVMYSETAYTTRFAGTQLWDNTAVHLIGVRYRTETSEWVFDQGLYPDVNAPEIAFTPQPGDRLLASVNFGTDKVEMFKGREGKTIQGIDIGYGVTDLKFHINKWNGGNNEGEIWVEGSFFTLGQEAFDSVVYAGYLSKGVPFTDSLHPTAPQWYIMYSSWEIIPRFASTGAPMHQQAARNLVGVRYNNGKWWFDCGAWPEPGIAEYEFTPRADDRLLAFIDFENPSNSRSLQGENFIEHGIQAGVMATDLRFNVNRWDNRDNTGEVHVTGSFFIPNDNE